MQIGNTTTLPPGSEATASTNKDAELNVVYLNLGIPQGQKGDKGDRGDVEMATFDVIDGKLIMNATTKSEEIGENYTFQLNDNKLEVVY